VLIPDLAIKHVIGLVGNGNMLVNHDRKLIFIAIPKCGSTSVWSKLVHSDQNWSTEIIQNHNGGRRHMTSYRLRDIGGYDGYETFGIARNPWDRTVSHYFMALNHPDDVYPNLHVNACIKGFDDFARRHKTNGKLASCLHYADPERRVHTWFTLDKMDELFDWLDVEPNHVNKGNHLHYSNYYTKETRWAIRQFYKDDIERFGFKYENE